MIVIHLFLEIPNHLPSQSALEKLWAPMRPLDHASPIAVILSRTLMMQYFSPFPVFIRSCVNVPKIQNLMREAGKKKHLWKKNIEPIFGKVSEGDEKNLCFFQNNFLSPKIECFYSEIGSNPMLALGWKKHMVFFSNALPKSNARAHLKQRKKTQWPKWWLASDQTPM